MYVSPVNSTNFEAKKLMLKKTLLNPEDIFVNSDKLLLSKFTNISSKETRLNRALLQKTSNLKSLHYSSSSPEAEEAKGVVVGMTMTNAFMGFFSAQFPGLDEVVLSSVEATMGLKIVKGIYGFSFGDAVIKSIMLAVKAHIVGKIASKSVSWIPGIGNLVNAGVAGYTTKAFGYALIDECERIKREIERGKKIDDILRS